MDATLFYLKIIDFKKNQKPRLKDLQCFDDSNQLKSF